MEERPVYRGFMEKGGEKAEGSSQGEVNVVLLFFRGNGKYFPVAYLPQTTHSAFTSHWKYYFLGNV